MKSAPRKMALLKINAEGIRTLLDLPHEAEIIRIELAAGHHGLFNFIVEGVGWPTHEGEAIRPTYGTMCHRSSRLVHWDFPE